VTSQQLPRTCSKVECSGTLDGTAYQVRLPKRWNGTLLIWSHGYRQPEPAPPDFAPVETAAEAAPTDAVARTLLDEGYALAGSAYATNGWAVDDGVKAANGLYSWFVTHEAKPARTYVWGVSLGGLITETLAEHAPWVTAAAPLCGVLAGANQTLDLALDGAFALKVLLDPALKLTGYGSFQEGVDAWTGAERAVAKAAGSGSNEQLAKLVLVAALVHPSAKTAAQDGSTTTSQLTAEATSMLTGLGYGTFDRWEFEQRVGGNPSSNVGVNYASRVSAGDRALIDGLAPGRFDAWVAQLASAPRVSADPAARTKADALGNPTGDLRVPTVTMHTEFDDTVPVFEETVFAQRVHDSRTRRYDAYQLYTAPPPTYTAAPYGAGHCNFTANEFTGAVTVLDQWVRTGAYPWSAQTTADIGSPTGLDLSYSPPPWPGSPTP
jgi:dienelactone hydrolase